LADFIHLRVHTAYSLAEGAIKVKELIKLCSAQNMPAVAVTDSGNLFGALEFATSAADTGIQPIIGCQLAIHREGSDRKGRVFDPEPLPLIAQSHVGYANLMALVTKAYVEGQAHEEPQLRLSDLEGKSDGLLALTGGPGGSLNRLLLDNHEEAAKAYLEKLQGLFPNRLYIELQRHGVEQETLVEDALIDLAYDCDIPLVATNDCYFPDEDMYEAHDALLCIAGSRYINETNRRRLTPEHRFKTAAEMCKLFADIPEALENTLVIAKRCGYMPTRHKPILPPFDTAGGRNEAEELRVQAQEGLEQRLIKQVYQDKTDPEEQATIAQPYRERLEFELGVIEQMGFPGYFLIVADFIKWAKEQNIPVGPGRGSGAGSVVAWALTITDLDPLRFNLLFERFLNPERVSMPDFDIDFCQERRDEVISYVQKKYGRDKVAQIITFGKLQARAALRDVGRVLQMPYGQVDKITKLVPNNPANPISLAEAIAQEPQLQDLRRKEEVVDTLMGMALKLEGLYRNASTHAAGVVIGDRPLHELVALYRDPRSEMPATQFNMKWVEQAGLVKFDFLGLKTLTVIAKAIEEIQKTAGLEHFDISTVPLDDEASFTMLGRAETVGVFQMESAGMRDVLRQMKPDRFEDLIAVVALYRPGPMANIPNYIKRKHGEEDPDYLYPTLEPVLQETYGIIIYQEQVMQIAQVLAGYSLGGADLLRRAMGKKVQAEMDKQRKVFVDGAVERKVPKDQASQIFDLVDKFAGYGFNKSHAAAYALVAYHTAYLKANMPVEFMAASMTLDLNNTDKLNVFRAELKRMKVALLPPDINKSGVVFVVEMQPNGQKAIRYALAAIKNVGEQAMQALVKERETKGEFADIADLSRRLDTKAVNKRSFENLILAGCFDSLNRNRAQLFTAAESILRFAAHAASERESNQVSLFGESDTPDIELPDVQDWSNTERLGREFAAIGFYLSAHPLDSSRETLRRLNVCEYSDIPKFIREQGTTRVKLAGIQVSMKERTSAKGNRFAFAEFSDSSGQYECTLFSDLLSASRDLIKSGEPLLITVTVEQQEDMLRLTAHAIEPLEAAAAKATAGLKISVRDQQTLDHIHTLLAEKKQGRGQVILHLLLGDYDPYEVEIPLPGRFQLTPALRSAIKSLPGIADVQDI